MLTLLVIVFVVAMIVTALHIKYIGLPVEKGE